MDCVIPGHSVRTFSSAIQCLSKIGKDLYLDFDPIDGLTMRALNDAKSAFSAVEFAPCFFERCTAPTSTANSSNGRGRKRKTHPTSSSMSSSSASQDLRFSCRVPMRAMAPVVRPRKGVMTLRIKSEGHNAGNVNDNSSNNNDNDTNASLQLAFEFQLEVSNNSNNMQQQQQSANHHNYKSTFCKVIHRMGVAEVDNIAAVAPKDGCSELVAAPKVLMHWLEPIQRTAEGCLIFTKDSDMVVATSFNSTDTAGSNLAAATKQILKTETSINLEDLEEYDFQDHPGIPSNNGGGDDDDDDPTMPHCPMPDNVNQELVLVFAMKEAKALLAAEKIRILELIENILNDKNRKNVTEIYSEERRSPTLKIGQNSYTFELVEDTGTGKAYSNLILLDLAFLETTVLPFLVHDSVLFKNIQNDAVAQLIELYEATGKQTFIAIDEIEKYGVIAEKKLKEKKVIQLDNNKVLYVKDWRK